MSEERPPRIEVVMVHHGDGQAARLPVEVISASHDVELGITVVHQGPEKTLPEELELGLETARRGSGVVEVRPLVAAANGGFAAGLNLGVSRVLEACEPDYFFFMNHDLRVNPETLIGLVRAISAEPGTGAVGPVIIEDDCPHADCREDGRSPAEHFQVWNAGSEIEWPAARPRSRRHGELHDFAGEGIEDVGYLAGCGFLMSVEGVKRYFPLDESYFLYFEDAELGERLRRDGLRSQLVKHELVHHRPGSATLDDVAARRYYQTRSRILFSRRWAPPGLAPRLSRWAFCLRRLLGGGAGALGVIDAWTGRLRRWEEF